LTDENPGDFEKNASMDLINKFFLTPKYMSNIPKSKTNEQVLKSILHRKLKTLFTDSTARSEVAEILSGVGNARLQLAVLKLTDKNPTIKNIAETARYAKEDYRDILTWAENPRQMKHPAFGDSAKNQKQIEADLQEYNDWLAS
jgi:hypothetical protein